MVHPHAFVDRMEPRSLDQCQRSFSGYVADLQYETRYAGEYRSALKVPVYLLEKLNNGPELEHSGV